MLIMLYPLQLSNTIKYQDLATVAIYLQYGISDN